MIIVKLQGGLGNQMFQYAFARILAKNNNSKVLLDNSFFDDSIKKPGFTPRTFDLDIFENTYHLASQAKLLSFQRLSVTNKFKKRLGIPYPKTYEEISFKFNPKALSIKNPVYLKGYFQSHKYFIEYENFVKQIFSFPLKKLNSINHKLLLKVKDLNSVSVHIRRGDYINDKKTKAYHGSCSIDYYLEAIDLLNSKYKDLTLVFFSDDMEWVKKEFTNLEHSKIFVDHAQEHCFIDMLLMSSCKHNIIANSSFSWWGAWLNENTSKTVVAPKSWFRNKDLDTSTLLPDEWIKL